MIIGCNNFGNTEINVIKINFLFLYSISLLENLKVCMWLELCLPRSDHKLGSHSLPEGQLPDHQETPTTQGQLQSSRKVSAHRWILVWV